MSAVNKKIPMISNGGAGLAVLISDMIDSLPTAVVVTDADGVIFLVNRRAEYLFGYPCSSLAGELIQKLIPYGYDARGDTDVENADRRTADDERELVGVHHDGHEIPIEIAFGTLQRDDGDLVLCTIRDLRSQKHTEKVQLPADDETRLLDAAVRKTNASLRIADATMDVRGPRILFVNPTFTRMMGYSFDDVLGKPVQMLRGPGMDRQWNGKIHEDLRSGEPFQIEMTNHDKGGTLMRSHRLVAPIPNADGERTHFVGVQWDIAAEYDRGRIMEETQQFLGATINALSAHVVVISPTGFILAVNDAWRKFACANGAPDVDFIGMNYFDQCRASDAHPDDNGSECVAMGLQGMAAGESHEYYYEYECSSPTEERWFSVRGTPFNEPPPRRIVVAHTNITERKQAENRLRRRVDAQRLLSDMSTRFIDLPADRGEMAIHDALSAVASFLGADRVYFLQFEDGQTLRNVHAFSSTDLPKQQVFPIDAWRAYARSRVQIPTEHGQWVSLILNYLRPGRVFVVPAVSMLEERSQERRILEQVGIQSILCVPMVQGRMVIGFVAVDMMGSERAWSEDDGVFLQSIPEILAPTLSRWRSEELLRSIVRGVAESTGATFLSVLVQQICHGLEVDYALVAEVVGEGQARTLAFVGPNGTMDNVSLMLADTPAADIVEHGETCIYRKDIRAKFPNDAMFADLNVAAYAGVPLCDTNDRVIGFMSIMHSRLFGTTKLVIDVLRVFAARAASEIDRRRKDDELIALNHSLERRVAERAAEVARQAAAMDATTEGMAVLEGDTYIYMNDAHAQMFGYPSGRSLLGHSWSELFPHAESQRIAGEIIPVLQRDGQFRGELIGTRRDGSTFDLRIAISFTDGHDLICCCEDISEQKRIQRELSAHRDELRVANIEMSRAAQLKDEFLASMSHELRTPLNAILGMTETMIEQMVGPVNEKQKSCLRVVEESGRHLLSLINDILDLSKIEAGTLELELSTVDARAACEACLRLIQPAADAKKHRVSVNFSPNVGVIRADERRVKQMLVNLLDNAVKFTPDGGVVGIDLNQDPLGGFISFTVWDNGIGIAGEHQTLLFKPFSQLEHGLAKQHPGAGLGLSIVKRIAELHGGSVSIESAAGIGSRFTLTLPCKVSNTRPPGSMANAESKRGADQGGSQFRCILLVDDNLSNLEMLRDYLSLKGYDVFTASSASEALDLVDLLPLCAILMDIQMPEMDGLEAIRILRKDPRNVHLPIIAVTALAMPGDRERCIAAGATEYVHKPVSPKGISRLLQRLLQV